jgi:hypothetical protein
MSLRSPAADNKPSGATGLCGDGGILRPASKASGVVFGLLGARAVVSPKKSTGQSHFSVTSDLVIHRLRISSFEDFSSKLLKTRDLFSIFL